MALQVGYDLTAGLPGHIGTVTVTATGGSATVVNVVTPDSSSLAAGLFVKLGGEAYEIAAVDSATEFTLVEVCDVLLLLLPLLLPLWLMCALQHSSWLRNGEHLARLRTADQLATSRPSAVALLPRETVSSSLLNVAVNTPSLPNIRDSRDLCGRRSRSRRIQFPN